MAKMKVKIKPVRMIRSPNKSIEGIPRNYGSTVDEVIVIGEYEQGLRDIEGFSHVIILLILHKPKGYSLLVKPLYYEGLRGVFATRHRNRPNPICFTVAELLERK